MNEPSLNEQEKAPTPVASGDWSAGKRWQRLGVILWRCLCEKSLLDLRLWIATRQEKRMMCLWGNVHSLPRQQDESMAVSGASVMNPNRSDRKRQIFRLVDECHAENVATIRWVGDAGHLDTEWESLLYDRQPKSDKLSNPIPCCDDGCHSHVRVAPTPNAGAEAQTPRR